MSDTFISSSSQMNDNKTTYRVLAALFVANMIAVYYLSYHRQCQTPVADQCSIGNPIWCDTLIEQAKAQHDTLQSQMDRLHAIAEVYRAIAKLGTWSNEKLNESNQ